MSERKVVNHYYPPDFDPSKIPRLHLSKERQIQVRMMSPFTMRCSTCGEYIYKGKKFNAMKETVRGQDYLGVIKVFRFYIKCTRCLAEITFKTDPENSNYEAEHGATRLKFTEAAASGREQKAATDEEDFPMAMRTEASKREMEILEGLEDLRYRNKREENVDFEKLLQQNAELTKKVKTAQEDEDEDEAFIRSVFDHPLMKKRLSKKRRK